MTDPRDLRVAATLRNGTAVTIRHVRSDDRGRFARAFRGLERESVYTRFFRYIDEEPTEAQLTRATQPNPEWEVALVVTTGAGDDEAIIAGGRYIVQNVTGKRSAEIAFMVEEDYQGLGLAGRVLQHLVEIGRQQRIAFFEADVLSGNASMLRVFARSGLPMKQRREGDVIHIELSLGGR